jgi:hypothetical protein
MSAQSNYEDDDENFLSIALEVQAEQRAGGSQEEVTRWIRGEGMSAEQVEHGDESPRGGDARAQRR